MACAADRSVAMGGWRAAALSGAVAPGSRGPGSVSRPWLELAPERVEFKAQVLGDFSSAPTNPQQLLCLGGDLRRHHRSTACRTRCVERFHAPGRYLLTLRMTLFFETPKARTISTWRHAPTQISWAVSI